MNINKKVATLYEDTLKKLGERKFFERVVGDCILERASVDFPEINMLDRSEGFFTLARRTGNQNYFIIGKILRRAAHRLYRDGKKRDSSYPVNKRFLAII